MKKVLSLIFLCLMAITMWAQKSAILVVQFGTSNDEGRAAALDVLFSDIKARYPQYEVREAYTSPTIRRILAKKNVKKDSATDALLRFPSNRGETVSSVETGCSRKSFPSVSADCTADFIVALHDVSFRTDLNIITQTCSTLRLKI